MLCTVGTHTLCLWPEHIKFLPAFQQMTERMDQIPADQVRLPTVVYEQGLRGKIDEGHGFGLLEGQPFDAASDIAIAADFSLPFCPLATPELNEERSNLFWRLSAWLTVHISGGGQPAALHGGFENEMAEVLPLTQQSEDVQARWVQARKDEIKGFVCP